jgi:hypothetical protein
MRGGGIEPVCREIQSNEGYILDDVHITGWSSGLSHWEEPQDIFFLENQIKSKIKAPIHFACPT